MICRVLGPDVRTCRLHVTVLNHGAARYSSSNQFSVILRQYPVFYYGNAF